MEELLITQRLIIITALQNSANIWVQLGEAEKAKELLKKAEDLTNSITKIIYK